MKSSCRIAALLLALAALALFAACSEGNDVLNSGQGNVRVVLTASGTSTAAASTDSGAPLAPGSTGTSGPSSVAWHDGDDDDGDGDHQGDDVLSRLAEANVTFSSLLARNLDGQLIDLAVELPRTVNLLDLMGGGEVTLPTGTLPPGMYDQIVVVITQVEFVFLDGGRITLTPPGGGWTRIVRVTPFEVIEGETVTIELQFRAFEAFRELNGQFQFFPEFSCNRR